jgi:hypothetical protein
VPGTFTVGGCPTVTAGLDGELARLHDRAPEGWPSCNAVRQRRIYGAKFVRTVAGSDSNLVRYETEQRRSLTVGLLDSEAEAGLGEEAIEERPGRYCIRLSLV